MKRNVKIFVSILIVLAMIFTMIACEDQTSSSTKDNNKTLDVANILSAAQPTPTDITYSLERYNLIRRAYWVNGQPEKAKTLPCPIASIPLGYVVLFAGNTTVARFIVEGKVSSLTNYLTPISQHYESNGSSFNNKWLSDVDGSYGDNQSGIFFFTPDKRYVEWTGTYLYSDIPFEISDPVVKYEVKK